MNLNDLAKLVTLEEGMRRNTSIAQVKEVLKIVFAKMAKMKPSQVKEILTKYR